MRPGLDNYFMRINVDVAARSTCLHHKVGAIAVRDRHILVTGYNGAPSNTADCPSRGGRRTDQPMCDKQVRKKVLR